MGTLLTEEVDKRTKKFQCATQQKLNRNTKADKQIFKNHPQKFPFRG
jgi:hypothetical protein